MSDTDSEKSYVKLNPREHVLLKPSMYLGDIDIREEDNYIFHEGKISKQKINWSPAFYKIFDEIIVNAYDQSIRDESLTTIKVNIKKSSIRVRNDGAGIDVFKHKKYNMYIPELIFGNLMTSTNFSQTDERITGGTHGLGAKLTNIFSKKFEVTVWDKKRKLTYFQIFENNLTEKSDPIIKEYDGSRGGVMIKFYPDFKRFKLKEIDEDHEKLFKKRVYDLTGLTRKKIYVNEQRININSWAGYLQLYDKDLHIYACNKHWKMGFKVEAEAYQLSFVNGIFTNKNGKHVDYIFDQILDKLSTKKEFKDINKRWLKNNLTLILKTSIINPSFNSQTKEELMTPYSKFGINCSLDNKFFKMINLSKLIELLRGKNNAIFGKTDGAKTSKIKGIPKLEDANFAGTKKSLECTLILTEGDSAKATAISGISSIQGGRNVYGVFPLRGKLLNVREAAMKKILKNAEISNLKKILGLKSNVQYTKDNIKHLRYGSVMLMMDADEDGSHIKGLLINFLNYFYPSLLKIEGFLKVLVTPVVKVTSKKDVFTFNTLTSYMTWKENQDLTKFKIKYYKGLGTSTAKEAGEYFNNIDNHIQFITDANDKTPHPHLELAFNKNYADHRKDWLRKYDINEKIQFAPRMKIDINKFINLEFKHFSNYDNIRSIPSMIDGFKPSQRKVIYACLKRNLVDEIKVAQLGGYVSEITSYHHGEVSLMMTIINLAQTFTGSNNINLLTPNGQFGTRLSGGKDHSSPRYIFTQLNNIIKLIIRKEDNGLLEYLDDDGFTIEPRMYYPVIPLALINGVEGIGTGFSTSLPNYDPMEIINILLDRLQNNTDKIAKIYPKYNGFKGPITKLDDDVFLTEGISEIDGDKLYIKELPIKVWTSDYKEFLEELIYSGNDFFSEISNQSSERDVLFILKIKDVNTVTRMSKSKNGVTTDLHKYLRLYKTIRVSNVHLFNEELSIKKYKYPGKIIKDYYGIRLQKYVERKAYMLKILKAELDLNENKMKWLEFIVKGTIQLQKMKNEQIISFLNNKKILKKDGSYDYLLNMSIRDMTQENINKLHTKIEKIKADIKKLQNKTPAQLWIDDLTELKTYIEKSN